MNPITKKAMSMAKPKTAAAKPAPGRSTGSLVVSYAVSGASSRRPVASSIAKPAPKRK